MRFLAGIALGLLAGIAIGAAGVFFLQHSNITVLQKSAKTVQPKLSETYFLCKPDSMNKDWPLIIKSRDGVARQIIYPGKTDADVYDVEEITDLLYIANWPNPESIDAFSTMNLNRVTGQLIVQHRLPAKAMSVLFDACDKRIPVTECTPRIEKVGGSWVDCFGLTNDNFCPRLKNTGLRDPLRAQCRKTETRF